MLVDPRLFNFIIMTLYAGTIVRWAFAREWNNAFYWLCALGITASVTFRR